MNSNKFRIVYKVDGNPQLDSRDWSMYSNVLNPNVKLKLDLLSQVNFIPFTGEPFQPFLVNSYGLMQLLFNVFQLILRRNKLESNKEHTYEVTQILEKCLKVKMLSLCL